MALFARLATLPGLPWDRTVLTLADERWVEPDDPASNEGLVRRTLAPALAQGARFVGLKSRGAVPVDGLAETELRLASVPRPFDLVLLGMGDDGHTASLFPGGEGLADALAGQGRLAASVVPAIPGPPRVTLTLPALLQAREIALLITGPSKRAVYDAALRPGPVEEFPVRGVLHQAAAPVTTWWAP
ncbi:6-phosphogluconolactonase [Aerophototrophica crusticola]|uniref:6-phosphogluconolactonase n=1 Tax=Aerophototrophica crusticola TaxID=1709002 RepID=UPI003850A24C